MEDLGVWLKNVPLCPVNPVLVKSKGMHGTVIGKNVRPKDREYDFEVLPLGKSIIPESHLYDDNIWHHLKRDDIEECDLKHCDECREKFLCFTTFDFNREMLKPEDFKNGK